MSRTVRVEGSPTQGIWRRFLLLLPLLVVLVLASRAYIHSKGAEYDYYGRRFRGDGVLTVDDVSLSKEGVVEVVSVGTSAVQSVHVAFRALGDGEVTAAIGPAGEQDVCTLRVRNGTIIEGNVGVSGWESIEVSLIVLMACAVMLFASAFIRLWRRSWYGYTMVACGGGLLFCLFQFLFFSVLLFRRSIIDLSDLLEMITSITEWFFYASLVPVTVLTLLVSISNVSLIRHEGLRPVNVLGIAVFLVWNGLLYAWLGWNSIGDLVYRLSGSPVVTTVVKTLLMTAVTYGECLLASTMLCAWLASWHVPEKAADYLVVLGCGLRKDGTPCPLLAGRVDRALEFDKMRSALGDKPATFVPSGGQGPDEVMSEAQSMRNYLVEKGVDPVRIVLEDRSETTRQNMAFSREAIERHAGRDVSELSVAFSTTNYHVFRGYVCAHQAGMAVEGMGSRTKYYFWPNAFLREFVGLLAVQWKSILQLYVLIAAIYGVAAYLVALA